MKKIILVSLQFQLFVLAVFGQTKPLPYGNNPAAGKYYEVRGIKMYTEVYGEGKPLLLIHGNGGSIDNFAATIPYFSKRFKVIAVDSRSQGKTRDIHDSLSFEMMADDLAALLEIMHIDSVYVIGWSDGGINALLLAMRHPEKVIRLVSSGANLTPDSSAIRPANRIEDQKAYEAGKNQTFTTENEKNNWKLLLLDWQQPNIPLTELKKIKCPSLIICGDHDIITVEHTAAIYAHISKAYLWVIPNSGHGTLTEHRDEFNKFVFRFFKEPFVNFN